MPVRTRQESVIPIHAAAVKAASRGNQKKMLGVSRNETCLANRGTGSKPCSPSRGLN